MRNKAVLHPEAVELRGDAGAADDPCFAAHGARCGLAWEEQPVLVAWPALGVKQALRGYERGNLRKMSFCTLLSICVKRGPFPPRFLLRSRFSLSGQSVLTHPALLALQARCWCQEEICCPALPCCLFVCPPHGCTSHTSSCTLLSPAPTPAQFQPPH